MMTDRIKELLNSSNTQDVILGLILMMESNLLEEIFVPYTNPYGERWFEISNSIPDIYNHLVIIDDNVFLIGRAGIYLIKRESKEEFKKHRTILYER